jgi:hypothetical protein
VVSIWYHQRMDLNVKGLDPEVADRLAAQAAAEGLSQQEWIRQVLRRTAARLSPAELLAQRAAVQPMSDPEFDRVRTTVAKRRRSAVERLGARQRRR